MTTTFAAVLKEFAGAFESFTRDGGSTSRKIKDGAPAWLATPDVMREIHSVIDDRLPNDWVYEAVSALADAFVDHEVDSVREARNAVHEIADGLVDTYNGDRLRWLADHLGNAALVDEACTDQGVSSDTDTFTRIGLGQMLAYERLAYAVIDAIEAEADTREA